MVELSLVFFGNEKLATGIPEVKPLIKNALENAGYKLEQVVTGRLSDLKPHKSKIAVLAAYGHIISQSVLDQFPLGIINVHPSLLPQYRGPTPIEQAILDGVSKTGVSIMRLTPAMDEGPIYRQRSVPLTGSETKQELANNLQQLGADMIRETLPQIVEGKLKPRSQPHPTRATYSRKLIKDDGIVDWNKPADQIEREIRAFAYWPGSHATLAGKDIIITKAHTEKENLKPGQVSAVNKQLLVGTAKGSLALDMLKPTGKNEMTAEAFLAGHKHLL